MAAWSIGASASTHLSVAALWTAIECSASRTSLDSVVGSAVLRMRAANAGSSSAGTGAAEPGGGTATTSSVAGGGTPAMAATTISSMSARDPGGAATTASATASALVLKVWAYSTSSGVMAGKVGRSGYKSPAQAAAAAARCPKTPKPRCGAARSGAPAGPTRKS